jgi:hypothetical protein
MLYISTDIKNVALHKKAEHNLTSQCFDATDGIWDCKMDSICSETAYTGKMNTDKAWWEVDLNKLYRVKRVSILYRGIIFLKDYM